MVKDQINFHLRLRFWIFWEGERETGTLGGETNAIKHIFSPLSNFSTGCSFTEENSIISWLRKKFTQIFGWEAYWHTAPTFPDNLRNVSKYLHQRSHYHTINYTCFLISRLSMKLLKSWDEMIHHQALSESRSVL